MYCHTAVVNAPCGRFKYKLKYSLIIFESNLEVNLPFEYLSVIT